MSLSASERAVVSSTSWLNRTERLVRVCERVCLCRVAMLLLLAYVACMLARSCCCVKYVVRGLGSGVSGPVLS